jgi:hypothetical protein
MKPPARPATPPPVEVDVQHQDILRAEADALGCLVTRPLPRRRQLLARASRLLDGLPRPAF